MKIPASKFVILSDVRKDIGDIGELAYSIKVHGQQHLIVAKPLEDGRYEICAGRRTFRALTDILEYKELKEGVNFRLASPDADCLVIQLIENLFRKDLAIAETAQLVCEIHSRQVNLMGKAGPGPKAGGWRIDDTASLLGLSRSYVSTLLTYDSLPEEDKKRCRTIDDLRGAVAKERKRTLLSKITAIVAEDSQQKKGDNARWLKNFHRADALDFVHKVPSDSIDLIFTDPPYGINIDESHSPTGSYVLYQDSPEEWKPLIEGLTKEFSRICCQDAFVIMWAPFQRFQELTEILRSSGFTVSSTPLIWTKGQAKTQDPRHLLRCVTEMAVYGWRGNPQLQQDSTNLFVCPLPSQQERIHPAQRPDALAQEIISIFCPPGGVVFDPFSGSGSTLRGCYLSGRKFIGCEKDKDYYNAAITLTREILG